MKTYCWRLVRSVQLREGLHLGVIVEESVDLETIGRLEVQTEGDTAAKGPFESAETTGVFTAGCWVGVACE